jgi:hypothetical protein
MPARHGARAPGESQAETQNSAAALLSSPRGESSRWKGKSVMRCSRAKNLLALHAGGDLPGRDVPALAAHLKQCPDCARAFEDMKRALKQVRTISEKAVPPPLPARFPDRLMKAMGAGKKDPERAVRPGLLIRRPAAVCGGIAILLLIASGIFFILRNGQGAPEGVPAAADRRPEVSTIWEKTHPLAGSFEGPFPLATWQVPRKAGVYAILHRRDGEKASKEYIVDYCGESGNMASYRGYPWLRHRLKRLIHYSGSADNLYIAVYLMPESSRHDRRALEKDIIETFKPHFNQGA